MDFEIFRNEMQSAMSSSMMLQVAYVGVSGGLFDSLDSAKSVAEIASATSSDAGYVDVWCDAAYAFGLLEWDGKFSLSEKGKYFSRQMPSLLQMPVQAVLSAHMMERAATFLKSGERPGEKVLAERESILPLFGEMLERSFGKMFETSILPQLDIYEKTHSKGGTVIDLGCGNGWYLRKIAQKFTGIQCIGVDGFAENICQAQEACRKDGVSGRVNFVQGDIYSFNPEKKADLVAMNRALHHVWEKKEAVFSILSRIVADGGYVVIWEPHWPEDKTVLRKSQWQGMAMQNISEYVQGNRFLNPAEIEAELERAGFSPQTHFFNNGAEAVVTGQRK